MPRTIKEPLERRNDILDTTQRLLISKGYERMTIQDVIDSLQISKGAFYHYFDSKQALLDALIDRITSQVINACLPIVDDVSLNALEKLHRIFDTSYQWKTAQKGLMLSLLHTWYADDNLIVRQKQTQATVQIIAPLLQRVIEQGIAEGTFQHPRSEMLGRIVMSLLVDQGEAVAREIMAAPLGKANWHQIGIIISTYTDAVERVLGIATGLLKLVDVEALEREWSEK